MRRSVEAEGNNWNQIEDYIFKWFSVLKTSPLALDLASNNKIIPSNQSHHVI